jgi:hypothetical protein
MHEQQTADADGPVAASAGEKGGGGQRQNTLSEYKIIGVFVEKSRVNPCRGYKNQILRCDVKIFCNLCPPILGVMRCLFIKFSGASMDKSVFQMDPPDVALEHRFKCAHPEKSGIKATFDRIRAQLAQEAEQRSRPVSRIYSGFRAVKA